MYIGLFFGSFNPIHVGHLIIAQYFINESDLEEVWMIVSPQNPFKEVSSLAKEEDRLHLVQLAIANNPKIKACDIEFKLPKPSYTIDTLDQLKEKFPEYKFALIMGEDNLQNFHNWKNYNKILQEHIVYVYNRSDHLGNISFDQSAHLKIVQAPLLDISSTKIRELIKSNKSIKYMVPDNVIDEMMKLKMYMG